MADWKIVVLLVQSFVVLVGGMLYESASVCESTGAKVQPRDPCTSGTGNLLNMGKVICFAVRLEFTVPNDCYDLGSEP